MPRITGHIKNYFVSQIYGDIPGLNISSCGHWTVNDHLLQNRTRSDYLIIYCVNGSGTYVEGKKEYRIKKGMLFAVFPDISHSYWCDEQGWEIWYSHFSGDMAGKLLKWLGLDVLNPVIQIGVKKELIHIFNEIISATVEKKINCEIDTSWLLYKLLLQIKTCKISGEMQNTGLQQALNSRAQNINEMAKCAGMSKYHFIREFKKAVGITPWQYILQRKITRAKELLHNRDKTIKQIAYETGFSNPDYFSTIFKKITGRKPGEFRDTLD
jgi:AraC family transcriptional regulator of arabinose operon